MYDKDNIFAKIIDGRVNVKKIYEDEYLIAIQDANPVAPIHILVIPKGEYTDFDDFVSKASENKIVHYYRMIKKIASDAGAKQYRLISNRGKNAGQSVFHFHTHIISGNFKSGLIDQLA